MKRSMLVFCGVLLALLLMPTLAGAQSPWGLPGWGWWSGITVQNASITRAVIWVAALPAAPITPSPTPAPPLTPTPVGSYLAHQFDADNVGFGESVTFLPGDFPGMTAGSFQGAGIINSTQPVHTIINLTNRRVSPYGIIGGVAGAQYRAPDPASVAGDLTWLSFPVVRQQYTVGTETRSTVLFVQNVSDRDRAAFTIDYVCTTGLYQQSIPGPVYPGQTVIIRPDGIVPAGAQCAATVVALRVPQESTAHYVEIAGTSSEYLASEASSIVATVLMTTRGLSQADSGSMLYAPVFKRKYPTHATQSRTTEAFVHNVTGSTINVLATFYGSGGTCPSPNTYQVYSGSIAALAAYRFVYPSGMPDGCLASATFQVVGDGSITGAVNEAYLDPTPGSGVQSATAYFMMKVDAGALRLLAPLYKERSGNKTSGLQVQNAGTASTNIHVEFKTPDHTWTTIDYPLAAGASRTFYLMSLCGVGCWVNGDQMPAGKAVSAVVYSVGPSPQPILGIVSEMTYYDTLPNCYGQGQGQTCYDRQNYEAFPQAP